MRVASSLWCIFFFSSRRRHTRLQGDWSSDVCSSDLVSTVTKGSHSLTAKVTDSAGDTATTPAIMINTTGMAMAAVAMTAAQIFPAPMSQASGMADLTVKLDTGATRGTVKLTGLSATAVTINEGFAGATGPALIRLSPSGDNTAEWEVPADALLTAEQLTALSQGKLYVIATSAANPRG